PIKKRKCHNGGLAGGWLQLAASPRSGVAEIDGFRIAVSWERRVGYPTRGRPPPVPRHSPVTQANWKATRGLHLGIRRNFIELSAESVPSSRLLCAGGNFFSLAM